MKKLSIILGLALLALVVSPSESKAGDTNTGILGAAQVAGDFIAPVTSETIVTGYKITCGGACQYALRSGVSTATIKLRPGLGAAGTEIVSLKGTHTCGGRPGMCFPTGIYGANLTNSTSTLEVFWEKVR